VIPHRAFLVLLVGGLLPAENVSVLDNPDAQRLLAIVDKLRPLQTPLDKPGPHDWLAVHPEPGQTFREYLRSDPITARGPRRAIYLQPIGEFTAAQQRVLTLTGEFLGAYFGLPVKTQPNLPLALIPPAARRHPSGGAEQILTGYVLQEVLKPRLPEDAAAYLALTSADLWPGEGWNFVFGQASVRDRVGVWSIYRNGDPDEGDAAFRLCLLRTLKTAAHETGHMFGMAHCTAYACGMNGSNHRAESDRRPLWLCAECAAKVCWATGADPLERYRKLAAFAAAQGLKAEREFYDRCVQTLSGK
jgi:archaemetzincin